MTDMKGISRRSFLTGSAVLGGAAALAGLAGCSPAPKDTSMAETGSAAEEDWLGEAPALTEADCDNVVDADVVVIEMCIRDRPAPGRREAPPHHRGQRHHLLQRQCAGRRDGHRRGLGYRGLHLRDLLGAAPFPRLREGAGNSRSPARRAGLSDSKQRRRIPNWRSWQSACGNGGRRPEASSLVSPLLLAAVGFYEVFEAFLGVFAGDAHAGKGLYRVAHLNAAVLDGEGAQYPSFFHVSTASPTPCFHVSGPAKQIKTGSCGGKVCRGLSTYYG